MQKCNVVSFTNLLVEIFLDFVGVPMQYVPAAQIDRLTTGSLSKANRKIFCKISPCQNLLELVNHNIFQLSIAEGQITAW